MDNRPRLAQVYKHKGRAIVGGTRLPFGARVLRIDGKTGAVSVSAHDAVYLMASVNWQPGPTPYPEWDEGGPEAVLENLGYRQSQADKSYWHLKETGDE